MADVEAAGGMSADGINTMPSNQENQDPDAPDDLRNMFYDGINKIGTHKSENLFEALEKRSLTDEEQAVIQERVAHQRKMFEVFERREKERKIRELKEVCPDFSEEEALAALDMCGGREDEAAACLVSDPNFVRRVKSACGTAVPLTRQGNGGSRGGRSWPARPTGPRPKLIDPSTLGDSVFVGTFRGKGFQGVSRGAKVQRPTARQQARTAAAAAAADGGEWEDEEEEAEVEEMEVQEQQVDEGMEEEGTPAHDEDVSGAGSEHAEGPAEGAPIPGGPSGVVAAAAAPTPPTVPKNYALVRETSEGDVRPVTDSELKRASTAIQGDLASPTGGAPAAAAASPNKGGANKGAAAAGRTRAAKIEEEKGSPLPTRASSRRVASAAVGTVTLSMLEKMVVKLSSMEDGEAVTWLGRMDPETASNVLQTLGSDFPERAVMLQELVEAQMTKAPAEEKVPEAEAAEIPAGAATTVEPMVVEEPAQGTEKEASGWDSEATMSEGTAPHQRAPASRERRSSGRPQRTASARKKFYIDEEEEEEDIDIEAAGRSARKTASKRRKSASQEDAVAAPVANTTAVPVPAAGPSSEPVAMEIEQQQPAAELHTTTDDEPASVPAASTRRVPRSSSSVAISARGHTNRGRVKQKSHKAADLVTVGTLHVANGWHNAGYIFPNGFQSRTLFRSSVALDQLCVHECFIIGKGGKYWPLPTFKVVSLDRPEEPLIAKSCTGCWTGVLKRINAEIEARRRAGEDLPPPPKTAIAGPEYFGLNQPNIQEAIEELDPDMECEAYWAGKRERQRAAAGLPAPVRDPNGAPRAPRAPRAAGGGGPSRRRRGSAASDDERGGGASDEDETQYMTNRWSAVSRTDRYRRRLEDNGDDTTALDADPDNPVPEIIDPVTLEPVVRPAISPYGHVMGAATWKAVLAENGICPFTKQPLRWEQCRILTNHNIEAYREKIIR